MKVPSNKTVSAPAVAESRGFGESVEAFASVAREYGLQIAALAGVVAFGLCLWINVAVATFLLLGAVMLVIASLTSQAKPAATVAPIYPGLTSGLPRQVQVGPGWSRRPPHPGRSQFPPPAPPHNPQA